MARWLGLAGLVPQLAFVLASWLGPPEWRWMALAMGWGYAALIFSFVGGLWWGLAAAAAGAADGRTAPAWLWLASVIPSLVALASFYPWVVGGPWPGPSLLLLGLAIGLSVLVDTRIAAICPAWWLSLRRPLSFGLGGLTVLLGLA